MFRFVPRIAVFLLLVASTLAPAAAGDRPLKASGGGEAFNGSLQGRGKATHFGRARLYMNLDNSNLKYGYFFPPERGNLRSASGDVLYFDFDEDIYFFDPETRVASATVTFTGGTGRFQDATGSADLTFEFDPVFFSFLFQIDGSIDY